MKSDPLPALWQTISQHWHSIGIANPPGATDADIDAFERTHGVRLPAEIREFYSHVDGMSLGEWDESLIRFWPLSEWNVVPVAFADVPRHTGLRRHRELPTRSRFVLRVRRPLDLDPRLRGSVDVGPHSRLPGGQHFRRRSLGSAIHIVRGVLAVVCKGFMGSDRAVAIVLS